MTGEGSWHADELAQAIGVEMYVAMVATCPLGEHCELEGMSVEIGRTSDEDSGRRLISEPG